MAVLSYQCNHLLFCLFLLKIFFSLKTKSNAIFILLKLKLKIFQNEKSFIEIFKLRIYMILQSYKSQTHARFLNFECLFCIGKEKLIFKKSNKI